MATLIENNARVLFQGDSITDAGWDRANPESLGCGYAMISAATFGALYPERKVTFMNRGISGNRICDLETRWSQDCLDLKPTWVSIMIGINDTWRIFDSNLPSPIHAYEKSYRSILKLSKERLNARFILIEPFVLPVPEDRKTWRTDVEQRINVVRALAGEFGALLVPMDGLFAEASAHREPAFWAGDGVHPSPSGHALIAQAWLRAVKAV